MQIVGLAVYNRHGEMRSLNFKLRSLNILTGESETGKSTVLDIIDFCLGRDDVELPGSRIFDTVGWFAVIIQSGDARILIARENPNTAHSSQAMFKTGNNNLTFPPVTDLGNNANTAVLRDQLSEWI